jgi:hypothetical protein
MDTLLGILQPGDEAIVRSSGRFVTLAAASATKKAGDF